MKKFINKIKNNKVLSILSVLIIGLFFILVTRITYAYLAPVINDAQTNVVGSTDTVDDFKFELGNPLKINATPTTLKENGSNYTTNTTAKALLKANSTKKTATFNYYVYFQIASNTFKYSDGSTPEIILTVTSPNGDEITSIDGLTYGTFNGVSGFDVTTKSGLFNIANNHEITSNSSTTYTTQSWNITLTYLNLPINQSTNFGNSMGVNMFIRKDILPTTLSDVCTSGDNLANCITTLSDKSSSIVTNIYHHDSTLANGAGDNSYRYAGASESVNNFVCFGSTTNPCPTDNLYRIIGAFEDKVKLIKYDYATSALLGTDGEYVDSVAYETKYKGSLTSIDAYYWNNVTKKNTWSLSNLNKINLNTNFINNIGSTWANKIATTTWKVGGNTFDNIGSSFPSIAYQNEIVNPSENTTYDAKIGLMYVSDYGFAASPSTWTKILFDNIDFDPKGIPISPINWMDMGHGDWTISRISDSSDDVFIVYKDGLVSRTSVNDSPGVRPSFNLSSSTTYVSGSGTMSNPIRVN